MNCVTLLRVRIANPMVMDIYCREGIVRVRFGCSRATREMTFQPTRPQRFMLPRELQRRYRRHLFNIKLLLQISLARRSLDQLSRLCIHSVQEFHVRLIHDDDEEEKEKETNEREQRTYL